MSEKILLSVRNLQVYYGAIHALKGINFDIKQGEIVSLIGSNGAGKTTTLRAISGLTETSGEIILDGKSITEVPTHKRVQHGIAQSPEGRGIFPNLTVLENMLMGAYSRNDKEIPSDLEKCYQLFPRLKEREKQIAGTLSGGEQQMLAISRALMCRPKLLLLDEPSLGLAPKIVSQIFEIIKQLNQNGMTILLVEQNANQALKISDRAYVLETGKISLEGRGPELLSNDDVRRCYLGV